MKKIILLLLLSSICKVCIGSTFYIDPMNGSDQGDGSFTAPWQTLENVISSNLIESRAYVTPYDQNAPQIVDKNIGAPIQVGDTIMLYSGLHGELFLDNYINSDFITIKAVANNIPIIKNAHIRAGEKWRLEDVTISSEPYNQYINNKLVFLESHTWQGPVSTIEIINCHVFSSVTPWTVANDWITKASGGIIIRGDSILIKDNVLENVILGITMEGQYIHVIGNSVTNFSADGIRIIGSNNLVESNTIKNCYNVDGNHDDGIQSYTTGGAVVDNNIVRRNVILNYEDPNQPLSGPLQGIGCFNGPFNNWIVENNLVIVNHWHGISFYGGNNCQIINNTVLDPTPDLTPGPAWIKIEDLSGNPSLNCMVKNNVSNSLEISPNSNTTQGNNKQLSSYTDYSNNFVDYENIDFHLLQNSSLIDSADLMVSPSIDLDGMSRPQGSSSDIGAYEYDFIVSTKDVSQEQSIKIYPNPTSDKMQIEGDFNKLTIRLYNELGQAIKTFTSVQLPYTMDVESIPNGIYFIKIINDSGVQLNTYKVLKQ
ncbi:MAG: Unknown protein [uncultured Aureispira sp.]|uniref:Secretion system C-terminal sorting domain-containing protein n=1 Tax=uncultured Aureispira sp. TaxID=1331704 RepID=A0A6S6UHW6_9BACT|nr:MAG: Unknown protein [uncultured Aureispira sp.]